MIIKQLTKVSFDRVIKHSYIEKALALESYATKLKEDIEIVLVNTNADVEQIKKQAYADTVTQLVADNQQLLSYVEDKLSSVLHGLGEDVYNIVYRVLSKLGIDNIGSHQIRGLLKNEFDNFSQIKKLRVIANQDVITHLQGEFNFVGETCEWEVDSNLSDVECIATTHLWSFRLDLSVVRDKIKQILCINEVKENICV